MADKSLANSAFTTLQKEHAELLQSVGAINSGLLDCIDKTDDLSHRVGFVSRACGRSAGWIDRSAADELCSTVDAIQQEMGELSERMNSVLQAVQA